VSRVRRKHEVLLRLLRGHFYIFIAATRRSRLKRAPWRVQTSFTGPVPWDR